MVIEIVELEQKGFKPLADYILSSVASKDNIDIKNICYNFAIIHPKKEEIDIACSIWNGEVLEPLYIPYIHANINNLIQPKVMLAIKYLSIIDTINIGNNIFVKFFQYVGISIFITL